MVLLGITADCLFSKAQFLNQSLIPAFIGSFQVFQKSFSLADQSHQAPTGMKILFMGLEMANQLVDSFSQDSYLDFWGTRISRMHLIVLNDFCLNFLR